jgi:hypothetical protein
MNDRKKCSKIKLSVYSLYTNYICLSVQQVNHFILYVIKIWYYKTKRMSNHHESYTTA